MINDLTPAQIARFPEFVERWTKIGLCTDPINREQARAAVHLMYKVAGLPAPGKIIFTGSPLSLIMLVALPATRHVEFLKSMLDSVKDTVAASIWKSVQKSVKSNISADALDTAYHAVWDSVWDNVWAVVHESVTASIAAGVSGRVLESMRTGVLTDVSSAVAEPITENVLASIQTIVSQSIVNIPITTVFGQQEAPWLAFYDYASEVLGFKEQTAQLCGLQAVAKSCGWIMPRRDICLVSDRPSIIHGDRMPAIEWRDGWQIFATHGKPKTS